MIRFALILRSGIALAMCAAHGVTAVAKEKGEKSDPTEALESAARYADCIVAKRTDLARSAVLDDVHEMKGQYKKLLDPDCLKARRADQYIEFMKFPGDTLHELLANALVRREFANSGLTDFSAVPVPTRPAFMPMPEAELAQLSPEARQQRLDGEKKFRTGLFLSEVGECVARRSPEAVRALAFTAVASSVEKDSLKSLLPDVQACVPEGTSFRIHPSNLRGPLIRAYYDLARRTTAVQPAAARVAN